MDKLTKMAIFAELEEKEEKLEKTTDPLEQYKLQAKIDDLRTKLVIPDVAERIFKNMR